MALRPIIESPSSTVFKYNIVILEANEIKKQTNQIWCVLLFMNVLRTVKSGLPDQDRLKN